MRPSFYNNHFMLLTEVWMRLWGHMVSKRGQSVFPAMIIIEVVEMIASDEDHALDLLPYPYIGLDWRACPNIFFTQDKPPNERGNISVMFKLV